MVGDGRRRMPPSWACFGVAVMLALVAAWPFVLLGRPEEPWAQSVTYAVAGVFVARGVAGFTPTWSPGGSVQYLSMTARLRTTPRATSTCGRMTESSTKQ